MKNLLFVLMVLAAASCTSKSGSSLTVEGNIRNGQVGMVFLEEISGTQPLIVDSAKVDAKGHFLIRTTTKEEEGMYGLRADAGTVPFAIFVNDTRKITVNADFTNRQEPYTVSGSPASQELLTFQKQSFEKFGLLNNLVRQMNDAPRFAQGDTSLAARSSDSSQNTQYAQFLQTINEIKASATDLVNRSASPTVALYALGLPQRYLMQQFNMKAFNRSEMEAFANKLAGRFPNDPAVQELKKSTVPAQAPDFTMADTSGNAVALSSFRGKYVLVDFWASWCGPCRQENPNVVNAYRQFHDRNFTVLGVSLDDKKEAWLKAIHDDGLEWNHVSDLKGWQSEGAKLYGVNSIPSNFLLDPQGRIIAEDIRGPELISTLNSVLK